MTKGTVQENETQQPTKKRNQRSVQPDSNEESTSLVGAGSITIADSALFILQVGASVIALSFLIQMMGLWAFAALGATYGVFALLGDFLMQRKQGKKFSFIGAFIGHPQAA